MTKVKICGLSRTEDIATANSAMPDYIGLVFAPSRRRIDEKTAAILKEQLDPRIKVAGVFVNHDIEAIARLHQDGVIDVAQLHGDEDDDYVARLQDSCGCPVIKAIGIGETLPPLPRSADYLLFDTLSSQRGGTGQTFDWNVIEDVASKPYFLAGGLTPDNVTDAIKRLTPFCVDVSGGVETDGLKDARKIHEFVCLVRKDDLATELIEGSK